MYIVTRLQGVVMTNSGRWGAAINCMVEEELGGNKELQEVLGDVVNINVEQVDRSPLLCGRGT